MRHVYGYVALAVPCSLAVEAHPFDETRRGGESTPIPPLECERFSAMTTTGGVAWRGPDRKDVALCPTAAVESTPPLAAALLRSDL